MMSFPTRRIRSPSWAYDYAFAKADIIDNRALDVACYHPGYTFVEKLQTISTKYRRQQEDKSFPANFMRHYYDVYCLLKESAVIDFIGTDDYERHKRKRFTASDNLILRRKRSVFAQRSGHPAKPTEAHTNNRARCFTVLHRLLKPFLPR